MKKLLLRTCATFLSITILTSFSLQAAQPVSPKQYTGERSTDDGSIVGKNQYREKHGGFNISWEVSYDDRVARAPWHYVYWIEGDQKNQQLKKNLSDFLLGTNSKATAEDFYFIKGGSFEGTDTFTNKDYKNLPDAPWFGLSFEDIDANKTIIEFYSRWSPSWGDFFGQSTHSSSYAYNDAFGTEPSPDGYPFDRWVVTPGDQRSALPVPEPHHFLVLATLLTFAALGARARKCGVQRSQSL